MILLGTYLGKKEESESSVESTKEDEKVESLSVEPNSAEEAMLKLIKTLPNGSARKRLEETTKEEIQKEAMKRVQDAAIAKLIGSKATETDGYFQFTDEQLNFIAENYGATNFGKLIPMLAAYSKSGKMVLDFDAIYYLASGLKPIIHPDGTIRVVNLIDLEQSVWMTMESGIPFVVRNKESGKTKVITKEYLESMSIEGGADTFLEKASKYDRLKDIVEKKFLPMEKEFESMKNLRDELEKLKTENETLRASASASTELEELRNKNEEIKELAKKATEQLKKRVSELEGEISTLKESNQEAHTPLDNMQSQKTNITNAKDEEQKAKSAIEKKEMPSKNNENGAAAITSQELQRQRVEFIKLISSYFKNERNNLSGGVLAEIGLVSVSRNKTNNNLELLFSYSAKDNLYRFVVGANALSEKAMPRFQSYAFLDKESEQVYTGKGFTVSLEEKEYVPCKKTVLLPFKKLKKEFEDKDLKLIQEKINNKDTMSMLMLTPGEFFDV